MLRVSNWQLETYIAIKNQHSYLKYAEENYGLEPRFYDKPH